MQWFLLNFIPVSQSSRFRTPNICVQHFNCSHNLNLELFAPKFTSIQNIKGKPVRRERPLIYHYVFVKGEFEEIKKLCSLQNGFSFVVNRSDTKRYATVSEDEMFQFKRLARFYSNELPIFFPEDVNLEEGDKVEIVEGDFPGLKGYFFPQNKSKNGNLCLQLSQHLATVVYNVKADSIRILEFAKGSKRVYDHIDAIIPVLYGALRKTALRQPLTHKEASQLTLFVRRYSQAKTGGKKTDARLNGILAAVANIIGDYEKEKQFRDRFERLRNNITSPQVLAFMLLLESVTLSKPDKTGEALEILNQIKSKNSDHLSLLRNELLFHYSN